MAQALRPHFQLAFLKGLARHSSDRDLPTLCAALADRFPFLGRVAFPPVQAPVFAGRFPVNLIGPFADARTVVRALDALGTVAGEPPTSAFLTALLTQASAPTEAQRLAAGRWCFPSQTPPPPSSFLLPSEPSRI